MSSVKSSTNQDASTPEVVFIFDQLRTRSHLFHRFLATHPAFRPLWHPWIKAALFGPERHTRCARNLPARDEENNVSMLPYYGVDTYETCAQAFEKEVARASQDGKILLANEHLLNILKQDLMFAIARGECFERPSNPTAISDTIYDRLFPILLIRHPIHQVRSNYEMGLKATQMRPGDEDFSNTTTWAFARFLYDDLVSKGRNPIVVDGDDVLWRPLEVGKNICARLGLDAELIKDHWDPIEPGYGTNEPLIQAYLADVLQSRGVMRPDKMPAEHNLETELPLWQQKYGPEVAEQLADTVTRVLPDYEYLSAFKA